MGDTVNGLQAARQHARPHRPQMALNQSTADRIRTASERPIRDGDDGRPSVGKQLLHFVPDLFVGAGEAAWDMAKGVGTLIFHPVRTAKGMWTLATKLVSEPGPTLKAIGAALADPYITAVQSGHPGRAVGRGIVEIGSLFVSPADVINVARGGRAFVGATINGVRAGEGIGRSMTAGAKAARYTLSATSAARDAQVLANMGKASEALAMAEYASDALLVSQLGSKGAFSAMDAALKSVKWSREISVAGRTLTIGNFMAETGKVLGLRRFSLISGHLSRDLYTLASETHKAQTAVSLAENILAAGAARPGFWQRLGRMAVRNPQVFGPFTPALGAIPNVMGKINAVPTNLPAKEGLTPEAAEEIAFKYNLEHGVENVRAFISEVSGYAGNTIGPDTGTPDQIKQAQVLLRSAKYDVSATGVWDRATANAVIHFKRETGLRQSYRLASGEYAVNEYIDDRVINALLQRIDGTANPARSPLAVKP
ncbi:MAG: hypothetical protein FJZ01_25345 [Candidatus Sericytochromatia bacterium]|nr:hypothetical protein [Candidatus Tanganyikabacteria bacterium]